MTLVSSPGAEKSNVLQRIIDSGGIDQNKGHTPNTPAYDVRVTINGIEVEFKDFAEEVNRQLDSLVSEKASEMIREIGFGQLDDIRERIQSQLENLADEVKNRVDDLLKVNSHER